MKSLPGSHNVTRVVLDNGVTVLVYENFAAQSVVLSGSLRAGAQYETPEQNGLAALTASALMRGTERYDFDTLHTALEDVGADIALSAGTHRVSFYGKALAEDLSLLIDILADVLHRPAFPSAQIERLRGEVVTGLKIRSQDTRYRAARAFYETLYPPHHPYHHSVRGTLDTVPTLSREALREFHCRHYGPADMIIVIVGAVRAADAVALARTKFEGWHNAEQPPALVLPPLEPHTSTRRAVVPLQGKTQTDLVIGAIGPSRFDADYQAAMLANSVLGQFGMMGRIGRIVREELGLAYYASSQIDGGFGPGAWSVSAGVNPANVERAVDSIIEQIHLLTSEPVSDEDLSDNQSYFTGHLPLQLESNEGISGVLLNMEMFALGLDYLQTYRERIHRLTQDDLMAAARRYLNPDALVIGLCGPETVPGISELDEER